MVAQAGTSCWYLFPYCFEMWATQTQKIRDLNYKMAPKYIKSVEFCDDCWTHCHLVSYFYLVHIVYSRWNFFWHKDTLFSLLRTFLFANFFTTTLTRFSPEIQVLHLLLKGVIADIHWHTTLLLSCPFNNIIPWENLTMIQCEVMYCHYMNLPLFSESHIVDCLYKQFIICEDSNSHLNLMLHG